MSLFNTIAHHDTPRLGSVTPKGLGLVVVTLVLGAALGYVISENQPNITEASATATPAAVVAQSHGDFLRLNTTDLAWMTPTVVAAVPATNPAVMVDSFDFANVGSYDALNQIWANNHSVDARFLEMNLQPASGYTEPTSGPR